MRTSMMKVILAATSVAVLASPVMAHSWRYRHAPLGPDLSTNNALWGEPYYHGRAYGSAVYPPVGRFGPGAAIDGPPRVIDCVHVAFPQCSGGN
jgi:hypothetical protein